MLDNEINIENPEKKKIAKCVANVKVGDKVSAGSSILGCWDA